jgi:hypothetical protein
MNLRLSFLWQSPEQPATQTKKVPLILQVVVAQGFSTITAKRKHKSSKLEKNGLSCFKLHNKIHFRAFLNLGEHFCCT